MKLILTIIIIIIKLIKIHFSFIFITTLINRLLLNFEIIIECNNIGAEGAKALAEALKLNKTLTSIDLCNFF